MAKRKFTIVPKKRAVIKLVRFPESKPKKKTFRIIKKLPPRGDDLFGSIDQLNPFLMDNPPSWVKELQKKNRPKIKLTSFY